MKTQNGSKVKFIQNFIISSSFLAVILGFSIAGVITKDRDFSEMENRTLQVKPEFSKEKLKNGDFTAEIETYMSDQIFPKDQLVTLKTDVDRAQMKNYQNGVYFCKDGYYLQDYQENAELVSKNIEILNQFSETVSGQAQVSFLLAPNAVSVLSDKLPQITQTDDQLETIEYIKQNLNKNICFCCPYEQLKQGDEDGIQVFYRTDHHWTSEGAEISFNALMEKMGDGELNTEFELEILDDFYGTLYSKAPSSWVEADQVILKTNPDNRITVKYCGDGGDNDELAVSSIVTKEGIYDKKYAEQKDKYKTFLGGNFDLLEIETQGEKDENVLIIKDSYANALMPYFCEKYKRISMIDLRYYHMESMSVSEYVKSNNITKVIYVYNVDFINSDNNFIWMD